MSNPTPNPNQQHSQRVAMPLDQIRTMFEAGLDRACAAALNLPPGKYLRRMGTRRIRQYFADELITYCIAQNVHLEALRRISCALGDPFKAQTGKTAVDLADVAVTHIQRSRNASPDQLTEMSFAYMHAAGIIESSCAGVTDDPAWFDLDACDEFVGDVNDEAAYLDSRRLLQHHDQNPRWVLILDEAEPLPAPAAAPAAEQAGA